MRDLLVVIDMQNDFIDGVLGTKEACAIVDNVVAEMACYDRGNVFATMDTHGSNYLATLEGRNLPVEHCIKGTSGWELNEKIKTLIDVENIFEKPAFGSLDLAKHLTEISKTEEIRITLVGLCTDICVASNAILLKTFMPEVQIRVKANCCAGVSAESHEAALDTLQHCQIETLK